MPQFYTQAADASITSIAIGRIPPKDGDNQFIYDADPPYIAVTSYDLTTKLIDTREPQIPYELGRTRRKSAVWMSVWQRSGQPRNTLVMKWSRKREGETKGRGSVELGKGD